MDSVGVVLAAVPARELVLKHLMKHPGLLEGINSNAFTERDPRGAGHHDVPVRELVRVVLMAQRRPPHHRRLFRRQHSRHEAGRLRLCSVYPPGFVTFSKAAFFPDTTVAMP